MFGKWLSQFTMKMNDNFHEFLLKIDKLILYIKNMKKYFKNQCLKFCLIFVNKFWDYLKKIQV